MRTIFLLFALCVLIHPVGAQTDTTFIITGTESAPMSKSALVAARNQIFRLQEPSKTMFKFDIISLFPSHLGRDQLTYNNIDPDFSDYQILIQGGVEKKLRPDFSLNLTSAATLFQLRYGPRAQPQPYKVVEVQLEPRWYYNMARKIRHGGQAANFSGNYLGLAAHYGHYRGSNPNTRGYSVWGASFNWGMQRRLFGYGYFDVGYGIGIAHMGNDPYHHGGTYLFTQPRVQIGLAYYLPKSKSASNGYCEALRCFIEENKMWKIDLLNVADFYQDYRTTRFKLQPYVAYESKIGASQFSLQPAIQASYLRTFVKLPDPLFQYREINFTASLQARWYFTLKRRIALGRSGNNLSGMYCGLELATVFDRYNSDFRDGLFAHHGINRHRIAPILGIQYRFLRNGFGDCYFGFGPALEYYIYEETNLEYTKLENADLLSYTGGVRVGWAF